MKFDNPKVRDIIDDCVREILAEPDEAFLEFANSETRWELRLADELYKSLTPSDCFTSLPKAVGCLREKGGCGDEIQRTGHILPSWGLRCGRFPIFGMNNQKTISYEPTTKETVSA